MIVHYTIFCCLTNKVISILLIKSHIMTNISSSNFDGSFQHIISCGHFISNNMAPLVIFI